jgi:L-asparaginase II
MNNPVLVEVTRGNLVESRHRGAISVFDADGELRLTLGDTEAPVFPRSAIKAIQAIALVESGAPDAFGFNEKELALACSSHSSEQSHVQAARSMLNKAGLTEDVLECGGHWSFVEAVAIEQARRHDQTPTAIHNNCSGKHSGFVSTAAHLGIDPTGYINPEHEIQRNVRAVVEDLTGQVLGEDICGTDGCSIPTYALSLDSLALGFARLISGAGMSTNRAQAARRLTQACMNEPHYVAGTDRFCTTLMQAGGGRLFAKTGAEGVFCGAIPELGFGIALKCDDGNKRAAENMMAATFADLLDEGDPLQPMLATLKNQSLFNWNRIEVGQIRARSFYYPFVS